MGGRNQELCFRQIYSTGPLSRGVKGTQRQTWSSEEMSGLEIKLRSHQCLEVFSAMRTDEIAKEMTAHREEMLVLQLNSVTFQCGESEAA